MHLGGVSWLGVGFTVQVQVNKNRSPRGVYGLRRVCVRSAVAPTAPSPLRTCQPPSPLIRPCQTIPLLRGREYQTPHHTYLCVCVCIHWLAAIIRLVHLCPSPFASAKSDQKAFAESLRALRAKPWLRLGRRNVRPSAVLVLGFPSWHRPVHTQVLPGTVTRTSEAFFESPQISLC